MRRLLRENGLGLFFLVIFLLTLVGQSLAGRRAFNADQREHGEAALSYAHYLVSPSFGGAVMENWQLEFLQFSLFILGTIWLTQKGSNESKVVEDVGLESDQKQRVGGWERSLQNWQSEFLAVATMVLFTIYLRQRGSPESKPVGAPHDETATSG